MTLFGLYNCKWFIGTIFTLNLHPQPLEVEGVAVAEHLEVVFV